MLKIKFVAGSTFPFKIREAYVGPVDSSGEAWDVLVESGTPRNYAISFLGADSDPDNSGQGVVPVNGGQGVDIPAGAYCWSAWTDIGMNLSNDNDYLVTFYVDSSDTPPGGAGDTSYSDWQDVSAAVHSYSLAGNQASLCDWTAPAQHADIYGVEKIKVRYSDTGVYTSEVFNTYLNDPQYTKVSWNQARMNYPDAEIILRLRSSDNKDALLSDSVSWSIISNISQSSSGNVNIGGLSGGRYVQFQIEMQAKPSDGTHQTVDSFDMTPVLENITIHWQGGSRGVALSGIFRKDDDHGIFTIEIDDQPLVKGLVFKVTLSKDVLSKTIAKTSSVYAEPRNTGK